MKRNRVSHKIEQNIHKQESLLAMLPFEQDVQTEWNKGGRNPQIYSYRIKKN